MSELDLPLGYRKGPEVPACPAECDDMQCRLDGGHRDEWHMAQEPGRVRVWRIDDAGNVVQWPPPASGDEVVAVQPALFGEAR